MSLTDHIRQRERSPIGQFLIQQFPKTSSITKVANHQLRSAGTINPGIESWVYSHLGMAIDYRIRYSFAITPSHRLVAWLGASSLTSDQTEGIIGLGLGPYSLGLIDTFFKRLNASLETIQPVGRRLELDDEQVMARYCIVLALFEEAARSNRYLTGPLMLPTPRNSLNDLLSIPEDTWISDLCAMSWLFYDNYHHLLTSPHVLNPSFAGSSAVGGADADFIVDKCLIEIKASIEPEIRRHWLWQLAGYLLLDYEDAYHINAVGIYMARQGLLCTWSVAEFLSLLTGTDTIALTQLRQEFRTICKSISISYHQKP